MFYKILFIVLISWSNLLSSSISKNDFDELFLKINSKKFKTKQLIFKSPLMKIAIKANLKSIGSIDTLSLDNRYIFMGIMNNRVLINQKWHSKGSKIGEYTIESFEKKFVKLSKDSKVYFISQKNSIPKLYKANSNEVHIDEFVKKSLFKIKMNHKNSLLKNMKSGILVEEHVNLSFQNKEKLRSSLLIDKRSISLKQKNKSLVLGFFNNKKIMITLLNKFKIKNFKFMNLKKIHGFNYVVFLEEYQNPKGYLKLFPFSYEIDNKKIKHITKESKND